MWQNLGIDPELTSAHNYSVWIAAILSTLIVFLAISLIKIKLLLRSHRQLLHDDAERRRTEETLRESEER